MELNPTSHTLTRDTQSSDTLAHTHLKVGCTGRLNLRAEGERFVAKRPKQTPHLLPVGCEWIPAKQKQFLTEGTDHEKKKQQRIRKGIADIMMKTQVRNPPVSRCTLDHGYSSWNENIRGKHILM